MLNPKTEAPTRWWTDDERQRAGESWGEKERPPKSTGSPDNLGKEYEVPVASRQKLGVQERYPPRQKSRVESLKAKVEPLLT